jgi:hypothetical protein
VSAAGFDPFGVAGALFSPGSAGLRAGNADTPCLPGAFTAARDVGRLADAAGFLPALGVLALADFALVRARVAVGFAGFFFCGFITLMLISRPRIYRVRPLPGKQRFRHEVPIVALACPAYSQGDATRKEGLVLRPGRGYLRAISKGHYAPAQESLRLAPGRTR